MKQEDTPRPIQPRKRYEKPVLEMYGDLVEVTQSIMGKNMKDGASHPNKHFTS